MNDEELQNNLNAAHSSVNPYNKSIREQIHLEVRVRNIKLEEERKELLKINTHQRFYLTECPDLVADDHQYKGIDRDFPKYDDMPD